MSDRQAKLKRKLGRRRSGGCKPPLRNIAEKLVSTDHSEGTGHHAVFFNAETSYGPAGIKASVRVPDHDFAETSDVLHALVLGIIEEKIQFVEDWLRCVFDVVPGVQTADYFNVFTISDVGLLGATVSFYLPVENWKLMPEFPRVSFPNKWEFSWVRYRGTAFISTLALSSEDRSHLSSGCIVLMPESFQESWEAVIEVPELSVELHGNFDAATTSWKGNGRFIEAISSSSVDVRPDIDKSVVDSDVDFYAKSAQTYARVGYPLVISAEVLAQDAVDFKLNRAGKSANLVMQLQVDSSAIFTGHITPLTSGFALYVQSEVA